MPHMHATTTVEAGSEVTATYTIHDENGALIDNSEHSGIMSFVQGAGTVLRGIEHAVEGLEMGDSIHVALPPDQAFGPHRPELVFEAVRANLPPDITIEAGAVLLSGMGDRPKFSLRIVRVTDRGALLDGNHPLAGRTLIIDLEIIRIGRPESPQTGVNG
jgi:FKBP-type peptidyl-prolyl cis-trans isomerase SlyD